ncbi:flagellar biosynthetic protein FlhB [Aliiruegeria haliotis]|uniref:Flagellar biosynthetic protein FlhB n=1 Tax=Aliiruegeria haliotis TaxID=1280846 RepID=A0A2T0RPA3_9RHOB|nr:flagellar type III secretion system protein FlhB [Aliiruegeria haliotis]PRY23025.1 flagellar biosynthetic protein FlhB [Aliiruegeria haliotis]
MAEEEDDDKQHEPSQKKLDDARKRGEVPRSNDLTGAVVYLGFLVSALVLGSWAMTRIGEIGVQILEAPEWMQSASFAASSSSATGWVLASVGTAIVPVLAIPMLFGLAAVIAQRAFVVAPTRIEPKLSKISPLSNAKQKFGRSGLFEFAKSFVKLLLVATALSVFLLKRMDTIVPALTLSTGEISRLLGRLSLEFLAILIGMYGAIGLIDFLWQSSEHRRKNRMSQKELRDEAKESEGDPFMKQARRQKGQAIALNSMLADVAEANVVIVNPEHYAVALSWTAAKAGAPVCVAKGVDEIAARIREAATEAGVPIRRDPPTARALFASVEIGEEISADHYRAVAAAIRFADRIRELARRGVLE